jgi:Cu/Ag efflux protein CusF
VINPEIKTRKPLILAASLATTLTSSAAFAATMDATGVIKSTHFKNYSITLANGNIFSLPAGFAIKKLKTGEKISVAYVVENEHFIITSVREV